jgi:hypothetical protein
MSRPSSRISAFALLAACALALLLSPRLSLAQSTTITYQGRLLAEGQPAPGPTSMQFRLWDSPTGGVPLSPIVNSNVQVGPDGLFTLPLQFPATALANPNAHLEIALPSNPGGISVFIPLSPRQRLTPTPTAVSANSAAGWFASTNDQPATLVNIGVDATAVSVAPGSTISQTFVAPATGKLSAIAIRVSNNAALTGTANVVIERSGTPIGSATITPPFSVAGLLVLPVPALPDVTAGEPLRLSVTSSGGPVFVAVRGSTTDRYPAGFASGPGVPSAPFPDFEFAITTRLSTTIINNPVLFFRGGTAISDGPSNGNAQLAFLRGDTTAFTLAKTPNGTFALTSFERPGEPLLMTPDALVGIGTFTPIARLHVEGSTRITGPLTTLGDSSLANTAVAGTLAVAGATTLNAPATLNAATTLNAPLTVLGNATLGSAAAPSSVLAVGTAEITSVPLVASPPVTLRIAHKDPTTSGWPIRIENSATSSFQAGMRLSGAGFFEVTNRANSGLSTNFGRLDSNGVWTTVSDARLKSDIAPIAPDDLLNVVLALKPVSYHFATDPTKTTLTGLLAQDVRAVAPDLVRDDGETLTLNYAGLSVFAVGALQAQQRTIDLQRAQIDLLRANAAHDQRLLQDLLQRIEALERARNTP